MKQEGVRWSWRYSVWRVLASPLGNSASAQAYPNKPIHIVVPFPAGSSTDVVARTIATKLAQKLNQPVIVENKPGAGAMGGQIDVVIGSLIDSMPLIQSGKIKAIAVTSTKRAASLPNVSAVAETLAGFDAVGWHGVMAPLGTPRPIVDLLNREIVAILRMSDVVTKLEAVGALPAVTTPEEFGAFVRNEVAKWGEAIRVSGARAD